MKIMKIFSKKSIHGFQKYLSAKKIAEEIIPFVDFFINPEDLITEEIKNLLHHPGALEILDFAEGKIKLVSVYAKESGVLVGRQIKELKDDLPEYEHGANDKQICSLIALFLATTQQSSELLDS